MLIYTNDDRDNYIVKVQLILQRLKDVGLRFDLKKCTFVVKEVQYFEFIVKVSERTTVNLEKT